MTEDIVLPSILDVPDKIMPLISHFDNYRNFLLEGGRGGGKSHAVARFILYLTSKYKIRVVCGREIQHSITESVYSLFRDLIIQYELDFDISLTKIASRKTGAEIYFRGFREQGRFSIQGMEGVTVLWIDEAQAITKDTLDVLLPTIRKENAKIIFTMNRHIERDPVYSSFFSRSDCLHIRINYTDNKFCPNALIREAQICRDNSIEDYNHIWLGEPLSQGENALFNDKMIRESIDLRFNSEGTQRLIMGNDIARFGDDATVFTIIKSANIRQWEQVFMEEKRGWDTMQTCGRALDLRRTWRPSAHVIDDVGVGGGVTDRLKELSSPVTPFIANAASGNPLYFDKRTECYHIMADMMKRGELKIINDAGLIEELLSIRFDYKSNGKKYIVSKKEMKERGFKSPNKADALMMALSATNKVFNDRISTTRRQVESVHEYNVLAY